jgi:hypothetical protein
LLAISTVLMLFHWYKGEGGRGMKARETFWGDVIERYDSERE